MRHIFRVIALFVVAILIASSVYVVFFTGSQESEPKENGTNDKQNNDGNNATNGDDGGGNDGGERDYIHTVFIEVATAGWCTYCPEVADTVDDLYRSGDYQFYYMSLVHDESEQARNRLDDYNIQGVPITFIDGGYQVISGNEDKSVFEREIAAALSRETPKVHVEVTAEWDNITEEMNTIVLVENGEETSYTGRLQVYVAEKISRWFDYDGVPYHFAFLEYIIDKDTTVPAGGDVTVSETWDATGLDPDNLMVIAVVFNEKSTTRYSDPPDNTRAFEAFYADAANATEVAEGGNLPPEVGIVSPKKLRVHLFGSTREAGPFYWASGISFKLNKTVLLGRTTIKAYVSDDSAIDRVEFHMQGPIREWSETVDSEPYEWTWHALAFGKYTITVTAYDDEGKSSSASMDVWAFML